MSLPEGDLTLIGAPGRPQCAVVSRPPSETPEQALTAARETIEAHGLAWKQLYSIIRQPWGWDIVADVAERPTETGR